MALRKLERSEWKGYFDSLSKRMKSAILDVEVVGPEIGDQFEVKWQGFRGMSHDPKRDRFDVFTNDVDHAITHPKDIFVQEKAGFPESIEIIDQENNKQVIRLREACKVAS